MPPKRRRSRRDFGTVRKKGNRFYVEYTGLDGKQHTPGRSFPTATDAAGWLAGEKRLMDLGTWTPPAQRAIEATYTATTVSQWLEQFHDNIERNLKASTMANYRAVIRKRILAPIAPGNKDHDVTRLADIPLASLEKGDVYRWWDGLQRAYPKASTVNQQAYKRLKAALAEAVEREMIPVNPVEVKEAGKKVRPKEKYLPSDEELNLILEHMPERHKLLASLMLFHGLRIGEALALEQRHVNVEWLPVPWKPKISVTVEQNVQKIQKKGERTFLLIQPPKSQAGYRDVPIMGEHVNLLLNHWARFRPTARTRVQTHEGDKDVFLLSPTSTGKLMMDTSFRNILERAEVKAGVTTEIDPHCGRNWLITRLAEQGAHLKEIGQLLGQDDVQTILNVYMKVRAGRTTSLMDKVNNSLAPGAPGTIGEGKK